ncbi:VCBS repeat-containing protein, partial [candidate division KSB1 bacterium]|nr:VCBS repeat-containing protein [candidate division KSB1 bacterium]
MTADLTGVASSAVDWGDYDNDGDLDVIISGTTDALNRIARIYRNDDGTFTD